METHDEVRPGKLGYESVATVVCAVCGDSVQEPLASLPQAKCTFEHAGWIELDGVWRCSICQDGQ